MKQYSYIACSVIASLCFSSTLYAASTSTLNERFSQNAVSTAAIGALTQKPTLNTTEANDLIKNENKHLSTVMEQLHSSIKSAHKKNTLNHTHRLAKAVMTNPIHISGDISSDGTIIISPTGDVISTGDVIWNGNIETQNSHSVTSSVSFPINATSNEINFLTLQLNDATKMLTGIKTSMQNTLNILQAMKELASQAASGTHGSSDLQFMDRKFQGQLNAIKFVQTIDLIAGEKNLSGGDVHISFSKPQGKDVESTLNHLDIPLGAFDIESLDLDGLDIENPANAWLAIDRIHKAIETVNSDIIKSNAIYDAIALITSMPAILQNNYSLQNEALEVTLQGLSVSASSPDVRNGLEIELEYLKKAMTQVQTYVSLNGPVMVGGGDMHITIGDKADANNTIDIRLPRTDVKLNGFDAANLQSVQSTRQALDIVLKNIHEFVYNN